MRNFFATVETFVGLVALVLGIYEFHINDSHALGTCIWGGAMLVLAAWGYFLVDWEHGWDGRHDGAWIIRHRNKLIK
jgi:hypothetical protein